MLRDHRPLVVTFADKAAVRDYVADRVGAQYLPDAAVFDSPTELLTADLPDAFVLKPTHGSGAAIIVSPSAPVDARLPEDGSWVYRHVRPDDPGAARRRATRAAAGVDRFAPAPVAADVRAAVDRMLSPAAVPA